MSFEVIRTEAFEKQFKKLAKKHKSLPADLLALMNSPWSGASARFPRSERLCELF